MNDGKVVRSLPKLILLALFVLRCGVWTGDAQASPLIPVKLRLSWTWSSVDAIWTAAAEKGYFRDEGLDVTIDRGYGGLENAAALADGGCDFLIGDVNNVILFDAKSPKQKLISVMMLGDAYPGSVITWKGNGIRTPKDLEGKSIAAPLSSGGRVMFPAFAKAVGINQSKINWQTVNMALLEPQFSRHAYDAIATFTPTSLLNLKQIGVKSSQLTIFGFSDYGVDLYGQGINVRSDFANKNPEVVKKFLRATVRGIKFMLANKREALATLQKRDPTINIDVELERLNLENDMNWKHPFVEKNGVGGTDPVRLQKSIATVASVFNLKPAPTAQDIYTDKYLPPAQDRMLKF